MCTRVVYSGTNGMVATGRTMDWKTEMHSNLWVFPKGMERNGETGANSLKWTSRYGSVVTSAFEIASTDGMNEKGLSPEISTTQWRTVSESKNLIYFFESSLTPNTVWVKLRDLDLSAGAPVLKLSIANGETYHGNAAKEFKPAQPFKFMGIRD